jgi:hypothetical protein
MALSSANDGASRTLGLKILRVQGKGGRTDPRSGLGRPAWVDRPRPILARFGRPFSPVGPHVIMHFAPSTCMLLSMSSSCPRWWFSAHEVRSFTLQSPGVVTWEGRKRNTHTTQSREERKKEKKNCPDLMAMGKCA